MAYQTGIVNNAAALLAAIQGFATSNGWALNGDVLSKGGCYVRLTVPSAGELRIEGARNGNFAGADICPRYSRLNFTTWPTSATYHMVAFDSPDTLWVTLNYGVTDHVHLGFGTVEKYGAWDGGQWFHAHHTMSAVSIDSACFSLVDGEGSSYYGADFGCGLFWSQRDGRSWDSGAYYGKCSFLHCELRGYIWEATGSANDKTDLNVVHVPTVIGPAHKYSPNDFNGQTVLAPFSLFLQNTDGHYMSIGHVGHLRWLRMENYNPGDILTIGPDRWKVFPWHRLNPDYPDGSKVASGSTIISTGLLGVAVRYDGP